MSDLNIPIKTFIVEDEPLARKGISEYVDKTDFLIPVGQAADGLEALEKLQVQHEDVELLLLDIQMPGLSGVDLIGALKRPPEVIFTTAHPGFAVQGFELEAVDYLLKPITYPRFFKAALKAREKLRPMNTAVPLKRPENDQQELFLRLESRIERILVEDILYVESMQNYCRVVTTSGDLLPLIPLKDIEAALPEELFFQIHRSYIVALSKIESLEGNRVRIADRWLPVSRRRKERLTDKWIKGKTL
ncbi:MAG: LytTR family DNA-binding domain-containing protein [Bacteroidota bacterium]